MALRSLAAVIVLCLVFVGGLVWLATQQTYQKAAVAGPWCERAYARARTAAESAHVDRQTFGRGGEVPRSRTALNCAAVRRAQALGAASE